MEGDRRDDMGDAIEVGTGVVERYLTCLAAHDWDGLAATLRMRA